MAYVYDYNTPLATSWELVFRLKTLLVSAGWIVESSGDGLSAFSSTGDIITQKSTGANGMANANAWFRIQDPGGTRELCFQVDSGASVGRWKFKYSAAAKFTGGSPSSTVMPTATDEQFLCGSSVSTSVSWMNSTDNTYRWVAAASTTAPYSFYSVGYPANPTVQPTYSAFLIYDPLVAGTYPNADADPLVITTAQSGSSAFTGGTGGVPGSIVAASSPRGWILYGLTGASYESLPMQTYFLGTTHWLGQGLANVDASLFMKSYAWPVIYGRGNSLTQPAPGGWKGQSSLLMYSGYRFRPGTLLSYATKFDRIAFDDFTLPWNGQPLLV